MEQTVHRGARSFEGLQRIVKDIGARNILLVRGNTSYHASGAAAIVGKLADVSIHHFNGVKLNPNTESVAAAGSLYRAVKPDMVLAIGGGSVIDTAKAMMAWDSEPNISMLLASKLSIGSGRPVFVAAPTTAGSGSEATHFAVMYRGKNKYSIANPALRPDVAFLDPMLTLSCPRELTAASGADVLCQSVESYWSRGGTTLSRSWAEMALSDIRGTILAVIDDGSRVETREKMIEAAHLAGCAINISKTTAGHALSYGLTTHLHIPHGLAVLAIMQQIASSVVACGGQSESINSIAPLLGERDFSFVFEELAEQIWKRVPLSRYFLGLDDRGAGSLEKVLVRGVNVDRLSNHPVAMTSPQIAAIYRRVFDRHR